jgi:hypothetical protein
MLDVTGSSPSEIRQLDLDAFRLELADLSDDAVPGITFTVSYIHTPPLTVAAVTLARVVEIQDPYVVTFEDGLYNVNIAGGNSNISNVIIKNQVGVNTANSAGLTFSKQTEDQSFSDSRVWVNTASGLPGTTFPRGTPGSPVDNLADAQLIIAARSLPKRLHFKGSVIVPNLFDLDGYNIKGESSQLATIDFDSGSLNDDIVIEHATVLGDMSGGSTFDVCEIGVLTGFSGIMRGCGLATSVATRASVDSIFADCHSTVPGTSTPTVSIGATSTFQFRNYSGGIELQDMGAGCTGTVDANPAGIIVGPTNTGGILRLRGVGSVADTNGGTTISDADFVEGPTGSGGGGGSDYREV